MNKLCVTVVMLAGLAWGQAVPVNPSCITKDANGKVHWDGCRIALPSSAATHFSGETALATRASRLLGTSDNPSELGYYMITFPSPNECFTLGPVAADSRVLALYEAVSKGGFSLKASTGALSVWTIEEWSEFQTAPESKEFLEGKAKHCAATSSPGPIDVPAEKSILLRPRPCGPGEASTSPTSQCWDAGVDKYTCKDSRRVLLTSEDGAKHCVLFSQSKN